MLTIDDGGPAFPRPDSQRKPGAPGMSRADWFAGQALPALIARQPIGPIDHANLAARAYEIADAMIAESKE